MDHYDDADYRFDAEQLGRCPLCGRTREEGCRHCRICGKVDCLGACEEHEGGIDEYHPNDTRLD
jgi:hypothetical protein